MTPLAWIVGLVLPACGAEGIAGLPVPPPMDMTRIERPATPNTFLAGPAGMTPTPDAITAPANVPARTLYEQARKLFTQRKHTFVAAEYPDQMQVHYVVRTALMNYPDLVTVQVNETAAGQSTIIIWSRSVYGRSDFAVNRARTEAWLASLQQTNLR